MADDQSIHIEGEVSFDESLAKMTGAITKIMNSAAAGINKAVGGALRDVYRDTVKAGTEFDQMGRAARSGGERAKRAMKDAADAAREAANEAKAGATKTRAAWAGADTWMDDFVKSVRLSEQSVHELNTTKASDLLGGKSSFALIHHLLDETQRALRDVNAELRDASSTEDTAGNRMLRDRLRESVRVLNAEKAILTQVLKANSMTEEAISKERIAETKRRQAIEDAAGRARVVQLQGDLQRKLIAEKAAGNAVTQELRNQGRVAAQQARASAEVRIAVARTMGKSVLAIERGIGAGMRSALTGVGKVGETILSRFRINERNITDVTRTEISKRKGLFLSWTRSNERVLQTSVNRQERIMRSFQTRASTGVAGAVTGRGIGGGLFAGLAGGAAIIAGLRKGLNEASNIREQLSKIRVVLDEAAFSVVKFTRGSVEKFGLTRGAALEAAGGFAALVKGSGATREEAAKSSKVLLQLAADMASFNNTSVDDAITALRSGLSGESEPLRRFNVFLNDARLKAKALELGLYSGKGALDQYAKSQATLAIIMQDTVDQQGDFQRTSKGFANQMRMMQANVARLFAYASKPLMAVGTAILRHVNPAMKTLGLFIRGKLGPDMLMLRSAIIGVVGGLLALVAAKGAIETLQLIGMAARGVLTPFGSMLLIFGLAGAAIKVLMDNSEGFRLSMEAIGVIAKATVRPALDAVSDGIQWLRDKVTGGQDTIEAFGTALGSRLAQAAFWAATAINERVIPAVRGFARFITDTAYPALLGFGHLVGGVVVGALSAVGRVATSVGRAVAPFLEPLIEAVKYLPAIFSDVRSGLTSPMAGIRKGLGVIGEGVAGVIGNIIEKVGGLVPGIRDAVARIFTSDNLMPIASGVLQVVETIGYIVGNIATDPRFLAALAGIAAAAAIIVARLVEGVARGIAENIPEIGGYIGQGLAAGVSWVISNPATVLTALAGLTAILFAGSAIRSMMTAAGASSAQQYATSFASSLARTPRAMSDAMAGLFGGRAGGSSFATQFAKTTAENTRKAMIAEFQKVNRTIGAVGGSMMAVPKGWMIDQSTLDTQRQRLKDLTVGMSDARIQGYLLRDSFRTVGKAMPFLGTSISNIVHGDLKRASSSLRSFGQLARQSFSTGLSALTSTGYSGGQVIGSAVVGGIAAAMAGYQGGSSGTATGIGMGLAGVLASALMVGTINPAAGVAVAAIGTLTTAIGAQGAAAKKAAGESREWADALYKAADAAEYAAAFQGMLNDELNSEQQPTMQFLKGLVEQTGVTFTSIGEAAADGTKAVEAQLAKLFAPISSNGKFTAELKAWGYTWDEVFSNIADGKATSGTSGMADAFNATALAVGMTFDEAEALRETIDFLDDELGDAFNAAVINDARRAIAGVETKAEDLGGAADDTKGKLDDAFESAAVQADAARDAIDLATAAVQDFFNPDSTAFEQKWRDALLAIAGFKGAEFDPANTAFGQAQRSNEVARFGDQVGAAVNAAVASGVTDALAIDAYVLQPLRDQINATVTDPALKAGLLETLNGGKDLEALQLMIDTIVNEQSVVDAQSAIDAMFTDYKISADVQATLSPDERSKLMRLAEIAPEVMVGVKGFAEDPAKQAEVVNAIVTWMNKGLSTLDGSAITVPADGVGYSDLLASAYNAGLGVSDGLSDGIEEHRWRAVEAARETARQVGNAIAVPLEVRSPSKLTRRIGRWVAEGLAGGITSGASMVSRAATALTRAATKPLLKKSEIAGIFTDVFGASGSDTARDNWADAIDTLAERLGDVADTLADANEANRTGDADRRQRNILGESATSLSVGDVLGRENRSTLRDALDAAGSLAVEQLASGMGISDALKELRKRISSIVSTFTGSGFSAEQVRELVDQFGYGADDLKEFRKKIRKEQREVAEERSLAERIRRASASASEAQIRRSFVGQAMRNIVGSGFATTLAAAFRDARAVEGATPADVVSSTVEAVMDSLSRRGGTAATNRRSMAQIASELFGKIIGPNSAMSSQGGVLGARGEFTLAMNQALADSASVVSDLREIRKKRANGERLSAAERDMLNENAFSLNLRDVTGARNAQTITALAAAAAQVAQQQLASGMSADAVNSTFGRTLADIVESMAALGFNAKDVAQFLEMLGYSSDALDAFTAGLDDASTATGGGGSTPPAPAPITELPDPVIVQQTIYLPFGDPEANALAVGNAAALAVM